MSSVPMPSLPARTPLDDIQRERTRQIEVKGYDTAHDDRHTRGQLAGAAACYALAASGHHAAGEAIGSLWPWPDFPRPVPTMDREGDPSVAAVVAKNREYLVQAAALLLAEVERFDRGAGRSAPPSGLDEVRGLGPFNKAVTTSQGQLACAAACQALTVAGHRGAGAAIMQFWPWGKEPAPEPATAHSDYWMFDPGSAQGLQLRSELLLGIVMLATEIERLDTRPALAGPLDIPPGRTRQAHQAAMAQCDLAARFRQEGHKAAEDFHQFSAYILESWAAESLRDALDSEPSRSVLYRSAATLAMDCGLVKEAFGLAQRGLQGQPPVDIAHELRQIMGV